MTNNTKIQAIMDYIKKHSQKAGTEQAVIDLQTGLNILNKSMPESSPIEEDGDFGTQTYGCLANVCEQYSTQVICCKIRTAAISNKIFDTKNKKIDTEQQIEKVCCNLEELK